MDLPLPDGVTLNDLEEFDIADTVATNPERAAILGDMKLKYKTHRSRAIWGDQAAIVYLFDHYQLWAFHPAGFANINEWLMQPEINISPSEKSDMLFFIEAALTFEQSGSDINLFKVLDEIGIGKMRALVPRMRKAHEDEQLVEQFEPIIPELAAATTMNEMLDLVYPPGERVNFNPVGLIVDHNDGTFSFSIAGRLTFDQLEMTTRKLGIMEWQDAAGNPIPSPIIDTPRARR